MAYHTLHSRHLDQPTIDRRKAQFRRSRKAGLRNPEGRDTETRLYRFLLHIRVTYQATAYQPPTELLVGRKPRTRMNVVRPDIKATVL